MLFVWRRRGHNLVSISNVDPRTHAVSGRRLMWVGGAVSSFRTRVCFARCFDLRALSGRLGRPHTTVSVGWKFVDYGLGAMAATHSQVSTRVFQSIHFERFGAIGAWFILALGLAGRFVATSIGNLYEFAGPWQMGLLAVLVVFISIVSLTAKQKRWDWLGLTWASIYFTATVAGLHPTLGYWLFPTVIILACACAALSQLQPSRMLTGVTAVGIIVLLLQVLVEMSYLYLRHFGETDYHAQKFIGKVLDELPEQGLYVVDLSFVFDVYLSGRENSTERQFSGLLGQAA